MGLGNQLALAKEQAALVAAITTQVKKMYDETVSVTLEGQQMSKTFSKAYGILGDIISKFHETS